MTRYKSRWDASTWTVLAFVLACTIWPIFLDDGWVPVIISGVTLIGIIALLSSIHYAIEGNQLIVYTCGFHESYPIDKIAYVKPTKSMLAAPAASLTHRLEIGFTDRKVLKSAMPIIISPVRQKEFIAQLKSINPNIKTQQP